MKSWKTIALMAVFLMLMVGSAMPLAIASTQKSSKVQKYMPLISIVSGAKIIAEISADYIRISDNDATASIEFTKLPDTVKIKPLESITFKIKCHFEDEREKPHSSYIVWYGSKGRPGLLPYPVFKNFDSKEVDITPWGWTFTDEGNYKITISATIKGPGAEAYISREITVVVSSNNSTKSINPAIPSFSTIKTPNVQPNPSTNPISSSPAVTTNPVITKLFETISEQINSYNSNVETTPSPTPNPQPNPSPTPY